MKWRMAQRGMELPRKWRTLQGRMELQGEVAMELRGRVLAPLAHLKVAVAARPGDAHLPRGVPQQIQEMALRVEVEIRLQGRMSAQLQGLKMAVSAGPGDAHLPKRAPQHIPVMTLEVKVETELQGGMLTPLLLLKMVAAAEPGEAHLPRRLRYQMSTGNLWRLVALAKMVVLQPMGSGCRRWEGVGDLTPWIWPGVLQGQHRSWERQGSKMQIGFCLDEEPRARCHLWKRQEQSPGWSSLQHPREQLWMQMGIWTSREGERE